MEVPAAFTLTAPTQIEYRARWDGQGWVAVDSVSAAFAAEADPGFPLRGRECWATSFRSKLDPNASGGAAGHATPGRTVLDAVWTGPLRRYPPGRYRLWVRLKLDQRGRGRIRAVRGRARLARRGARRA